MMFSHVSQTLALFWAVSIKDATRHSGALVRENLIGNSLLDVVGFAGKDRQGFILRLPSEALHGAVVG